MEFTNSPPRKASRIFITLTWAAILAGLLACGFGWNTYFGRCLCGVSTITIRNDSEVPLQDVSLELSDARQTTITRHFNLILPHQQERVPVSTSDLHVQRMAFHQGHRKITYDQGGIACPGEILELVVNSSGDVSGVYVK